ncbi:probable palmitoyltransferase ZDHHC24 [Diorhabda sublineata]|uniref:probable palmitoyltransferase ZDHHC24 n=1 Tax=Diorhabda sublineata TaxID=1163346 RepID=UPI0024E0D7A4|nr:probable palmitoyltransferase ZDHHC24 [Diorhabda sublineata]
MNIRINIFPKCIRDAFVTGFLFVIMPVVYYFEMFVVLPKYYKQWSAWYNFHFVIGTTILFNICSNLIAIIMCDTSIKGRVLPTDLKPDWRFCSVCESVAPPRSWHCEVCKVCILKRDHHCMFTSCCIGFENHRYFLIFVFYMLIATLYASYYNMKFIKNFVTFDFSWTSIFKIVFPLATLFMEWTQNQLFIFLILIVFFGAGFSGALLYFHIDLMLRSVVTYERNTVSKYDKGKLENIKLVLGDKWYLVWLSPWIKSKLTCDGINWDKMLSLKEK